ncbi:MAG: GNAT family N-acetyltransferase [Pseudomonadota bacterium]
MITHYAGQFREIGTLFHEAVHRTASAFYTAAQCEAWAPTPGDQERWRWRCELKRPFVYLDGMAVIGFVELDPDGHIDCLYVHPDRNRQGIGSALVGHALAICREVGLERSYAQASHIAKGLFLQNGFTVTAFQTVEVRGQRLDNWLVERAP